MVERLEGILKVLVNFQHRGNVAASVAVVGRGPHGDQVLVLEPEFVALHDQLMSASNKVDAIDVIELGGDLGAEQPAGTAGRNGPSLTGEVLGIGPHQIAEGTFVRNLLLSVNHSDLIERLDLGRKSTVHAVNFIFDDGADR